MKRQEFDGYIRDNDISSLFNQMGWNNSDHEVPVIIPVEEERYHLQCVSQRNGFKVYTCLVATIPQMPIVKAIDKRLRKSSNDYILIFMSTCEKLHHEWIVPVKTIDKRVLVPVEYTTISQLDFLYSKHRDLSFGIEEESTILDVTKKVHSAFELNSEKVTKEFYTGFKKQHDGFAQFISGIEVDGDKQWYVSVMLNRLMFCYFIQKKNFLDFNPNYLRDKLEECKREQSRGTFFKSFYQSFLVQLFQGGLNNPSHDTAEFKARFGRIPYLNGGMFDQHQIEKQYADIDIEDEAFENLFDFFDKYKWHLDTRIEASGKDINPDVLGYIFEQYINDRAQKGAYYTKEDITNYIGKNCIIPFLVEDAQRRFGKDTSFIWNFLQDSEDRYIYESVKKGCGVELPENIAAGLDTERPGLLERRKDWNQNTPEEYGLPTEIWRETVERRRRYEETRQRIAAGEIREINDFITYNLDITGFVQDLLAQTDNLDFVRCFYEALRNVSVLDPTCGSGAFLFAALNILEPLYEICIDRLDFVQLEIKNNYRSNIQYFIYKSIILQNLYGVDIMAEATEIAKLRLFLKMVAVVEADRRLPNLGLDPLPDIDFNIRCGNTLVGYATKEELLNSFTDLFERAEWEAKLQRKLEEVAATYRVFKDRQLYQTERMDDFRTAKANLQKSLEELNGLLSRRLFSDRTGISYEDWLVSHQPFHWLAEFYEIIVQHGGFDVIIGNPPYVEKTEINYKISFSTAGYSNLFAYCMERIRLLSYEKSRNGLIVPMSLTSIREYKNLRLFLEKNYTNLFFTNHAIRPQSLFSGISQRVSIIFAFNSPISKKYTTSYLRTTNISEMFQLLQYCDINFERERDCLMPKIGNNIMKRIWLKVNEYKKDIIFFKSTSEPNFYFKDYGETYWIFPFSFVPYLTPVKSFKALSFDKQVLNKIFQTLNSSLFYVFYTIISDCWHFGIWHISEFPVSLANMKILNEDILSDSFKDNRIIRFDKRAKGDIYEYHINKSKPIIDKIDTLLAQHYGFTEEELDFIINYDIKYRMGRELEE